MDPNHVSSALTVARTIRALQNQVASIAPGPHSAEIATRMLSLVEDMQALNADGLSPWYYTLTRDERAQLIELTAGERTNSAGTSWTEFNPMAPPLLLELNDQEAFGTANLGPAFCGPPGRVHGGTVATMLDHVMGALTFHVARPSYTARLEVDYRAGAPLNENLDVHARIDKIDGRKTWVSATISFGGVVAARGNGLFVLIERP